MNTQNDFLFGSNGRVIVPVLPVLITSREQAFRTAAWIILMGETLPCENYNLAFDDVLEAVTSC